MDSFKPLIDAGKVLGERLRNQYSHRSKSKTKDVMSLPPSQRVSYAEIDTWFKNCNDLVHEIFGLNSREHSWWKDCLKNIDEIILNQREYISEIATADKIECALGVLNQFEPLLLIKKSTETKTAKPDDDLFELLKDLAKRPTIQIGSHSGPIALGDMNITNTYNEIIKKIDEAKDVPEAQKSKAKKILQAAKENNAAIIPLVVKGIERLLGL